MDSMHMLPGMRVVRGPDWSYQGKQDGGEGYVGTIVYVPKQDASDGMVTVVWDTGREVRYRAGQNGKYDLRIFDNATAGVIQEFITCDECSQEPIQGTRWKCTTCADFDLCTACYMKGKHDIAHPFVRMDTGKSVAVALPARMHTKSIQSQGIFPGADVMRGPHWRWKNDDGGEGQVGTVSKVTDWNGKVNYYHGGVEVLWQVTKTTGTYRLGGEGSVDLVLTKPGKGDVYYPSHLAVVDVISPGEIILKRSDKVRVNLDLKSFEQMQDNKIYGSWNPGMAQCTKEIGTVIDLHFGDKTVSLQYVDSKIWAVNRQALVRVHSFSPGDVVEILGEYNAVKNLQEGHGGWNDDMKDVLGKVGRIVLIAKDGDLKVKVPRGDIWILNPTCCMPCENSTRANDAPVVSAEEMKESEEEDASVEELARNMDKLANAVAQLFVGFLRGEPGATQGEITLVQAAAGGDLEAVKVILGKSPDKVNMQREGKTGLQLASYEGHKEVVSWLLQKGANMEMEDNEGNTALHYATFGKENATLTILLDKGAKTEKQNKNGHTALHFAIARASIPCINTLITRGANVTIKDNQEDTPMHVAIIQNMEQPAIVELVLGSKTADFTITNKRGFNVLHFATLRNFRRAVEVIIPRGKNMINSAMKDGYTALHIAAYNDHVEIASILLREAKAEINVRDKNQRTPLHLAVVQGHMRVVELLLTVGCDLFAEDDQGNTALHLVQMRTAGLPDLLGRLLGVKIQDEATLQISSLLIEAGGDISKKNKAGKTPLDLCTDESTKNFLRKVAEQAKTKSFVTTQKGIIIPPYWEKMDKKESLKRVPLNSIDILHKREMESVEKIFHHTLPQSQIVSIERIQNPFLWEHYFLTRRKFETQYGPGCANELDLFHGTMPKVIEPICNQNFDFRLAGDRAGTRYGKGAYFARHAKYSDRFSATDEKGLKYMFRAKVLAGKMTVGNSSYTRPPLINPADSTSKLYDSCVDNVTSPSIFCIFDQNQYFPEYLIIYK